jgi:hypothetical protein
MAAYTKAWVTPHDQGYISIAFERDDGLKGFMRVDRKGHPDLPQLMALLNPKDRQRVEERLSNVIPFPRS